MPLTLRDKLALAMTSAGSQRNLASLVGASHQQIGRWLREGEPGGAKKIPIEFAQAIEQAFAIHKDIAREQAKTDRLPFSESYPVLINRPPLRDGQPGERVYINATQFLGPQLRAEVLASQQRSKQYLGVSVRSTINLYSYIKTKPSASLAQQDRAIRSDSLASGFMAREQEQRGSNKAAPLFTRYENIMPGTEVRRSLMGVESKLRQKHEPHTGPRHPGTLLGDQILLQTVTNQYAQAQRLGSKGTPVKVGRSRKR